MNALKWTLLVLTLCTGLSAFAANDQGDGTDRGNGGDEYARSFMDYGLDVAEALAQSPVPGVDAHRLLEAVQNTKVNSQERLQLRGNEVDAINFPDAQPPRILLSRAAWDRLAEVPHRRAFLAFHEYLGILGIDDSRYQISGLLDRAKVCEKGAAVRTAIERRLLKSCYRVIQDDLRFIEYIEAPNLGRFCIQKEDFRGLPNLVGFRLVGEHLEPLAPDTFALAPNFRDFALNGLKEMADCRFLHSVPRLRSFGNDASTEEGVARSSLTDIEPGCFRKNTELKTLSLAFNGRTTSMGAFAGLEKLRKLEHVMLNIEHIDEYPVSEFLPIAKSSARWINFFTTMPIGDGEEYFKNLSSVMSGLNCYRNPGSPGFSVTCQR